MEQRKCENADGTNQNKRRQEKIFQSTQTGFYRYSMQIRIV
ncbi:hypothetical protein Tsp_05302 [Trichinella spiralis]|nr:hypothetical protein Tsp_05302 [Trichinella spiralis]